MHISLPRRSKCWQCNENASIIWSTWIRVEIFLNQPYGVPIITILKDQKHVFFLTELYWIEQTLSKLDNRWIKPDVFQVLNRTEPELFSDFCVTGINKTFQLVSIGFKKQKNNFGCQINRIANIQYLEIG